MKKAEELEKSLLGKIKGFVDFTKVKNNKIKALNALRIKIKEFWILAKELINKFEDDRRLLIISHFLNVFLRHV